MKLNKISFSTEDIKFKIYYKLNFAYILRVEINKDDFLEFLIWELQSWNCEVRAVS